MRTTTGIDSDERFNWTVYMGPCLQWEGDPLKNPICTGSCANGWTRDVNTGLWVCGGCRKPSHAYLRECDGCEQIYLPAVAELHRVHANQRFQYTLDHPQGEC